MNVPEIRAYQEKISAQLQEAKALLNGFEAQIQNLIESAHREGQESASLVVSRPG